MRLEASIEVAAPPETVWRVATDPTLSPRWNPNIVSVVGASSDPVTVGTTWVQVVRILGKSVEMRGEVTECDPPRAGTVRFSGPGDPVVTTTIEPLGDRCLLRQVMDLTIPTGIAGMGMRLGAHRIARQLEEALRRQRGEAEAAAAEMTGPDDHGKAANGR